MAWAVTIRDSRVCWLAIPAILMLFLVFLPILEIVRIVAASGAALPDLLKHLITTPLYARTILNTLGIALLVTGGALLVGYPIAFVVTHSSSRSEKILLGVTVASLWMSVLIRSYAWTVLLQTGGPLSTVLYNLGITAAPSSMLFSKTAVVLAMTHVLSPYMILAIWSTTATKAKSQLPIAEAFGATKLLYFLRIYIPQSTRGVLAGGIMVFILSIGFLITPELLGGGRGDTMMIAVLIDEQFNQFGNWAQGAILSLILLALVGVFFFVLWKLWSISQTTL